MIKVQKNISLKDLNTFKLGGRVKFFTQVSNNEEIKEALLWAKKNKVPTFILGGGSNILFPDGALNALLIKIESKKIILKDKNRVFAEAGVSLLKLILFCKEKNLSGIEWGAGIPGTLGGAIFGNAGAFGGEIKDIILKVFVIDKDTLEEKNFLKNQCKFSYRNSIFKERKKYIITGAILKLKKGKKEEIEKIIKEKILYRKNNHPLNLPSAGSIFKSVPFGKIKKETIKKYPEILNFKEKGEVPAGFLIEKCGLGGKEIGGAKISEKHKNFIVNIGNAKAKDVLSLIKFVKEKVKENFKVELEEEIIKIKNFFKKP